MTTLVTTRDRRSYMSKWRSANPELVKAQRRRKYQRNPSAACEQGKQWYASNKERARSLKLLRLYGVTLEQWNEIFVAQGSACAVCKCTEPGSKKGWHTDHCHETGRLRGILCHSCNLMLGYAKDCIDVLESAAAYVRGNQ